MKSIYSEGFAYPFFKSFFTPSIRPKMIKCISSIFQKFFFAQFKAKLLPGRIPVKDVDHPLDKKIPFVPRWIAIYLDFICYWTRIISFYYKRYGRKGYNIVGKFILSVGDLYEYAFLVYKKSFSTTKRPFYIARPRFFLIHLVDPHLMCIPSLHVMVALHAYKQFIEIAKHFNDEENLKEDIELMRQGALAIIQAILYVKQHSVNCIPAAFYVMTRYSPELYPPQEIYKFTDELFSPIAAAHAVPHAELPGGRINPAASPKTVLPENDKKEIIEYIKNTYNCFLEEGKTAKSWEEPLVNFLREI